MISSGSTYNLDDDEIEYYKKESLQGNGDASFKLYQYYSFSNFVKSEMIKWLEVSSLQGNKIAQYNYAVYLINNGGKDKALRLINEIESSGDRVSADKLKRMIK